MFVDGHERADVIKARDAFVKKYLEVRCMMLVVGMTVCLPGLPPEDDHSRARPGDG